MNLMGDFASANHASQSLNTDKGISDGACIITPFHVLMCPLSQYLHTDQGSSDRLYRKNVYLPSRKLESQSLHTDQGSFRKYPCQPTDFRPLK